MTVSLSKRFKKWTLIWIFLSVFAVHANAQFSSGSTGADGPLDYSSVPSGTTVLFDPSKFNPALHPLGQNVFNFTTINIPTGVTVILSGQLLKTPVFWLAQGDVNINGTVNLNGQPGSPSFTTNTSQRVPAVPGPGGFFGGIGGNGTFAPQPGDGPLGGGAGSVGNGPNGFGGGFSGNILFAPPIGGSGGGGTICPGASSFGPGGGGGGGSLILASSTLINLQGLINARGGDDTNNTSACFDAGGGAGGSVKLVANTITAHNGTILASGGGTRAGLNGSPGAIRLESFSLNQPGTDIGFSAADPGALFIPNQPVSIQVVSVAGIQLPAQPSGSFASPDVTINTGSPVTIALQTTGIPPGTILTLNIYSEDSTTQTVQTTPLQGTLQLSTATASVTFPPDLSMGVVKATWTTQ